MTDVNQYRHWVDKVREYREMVLYPELFGTRQRDPAPLTPTHLGYLGARNGYPKHWLTYGVHLFEPTASRPSWLYVTSGMSDDFEHEPPTNRLAGLGCEFVLETSSLSTLATDQLHYLMAWQLLASRQVRQTDPLGDFDRVPMLDSSDLIGSQLRWLMLGPPRQLPFEASQHSGNFDFFQVTAISEAEADYARTRGGPALLLRLEQAGAYPVVDWMRTEVV